MTVFMVFGGMGNGGGTYASMSRANMFARSGKPAAMVFLEWIPEYESRIREFRRAGRLDSAVDVVNPYKTLQAHLDQHQSRTQGQAIAWIKRKAQAIRLRLSGKYTVEISKRRKTRSVYRIRRFVDGQKIVEEHYSKSGALYTKLTFDKKGGH